MRTHGGLAAVLVLALLLLGSAIIAKESFARAGGGRSSGSSGSRSYAAPARTAPAPGQPASPAAGQPGGGLLRNMGGGLLGGLFGGFLFSTLFGGAAGGFGGGGIGMLEVLLLGAGGYILYTMATKKRREAALPQPSIPLPEGSASSRQDGTGQLRRHDLLFPDGNFKEAAMDIFFKVQAAWTGRDLSAESGLVTAEMNGILQEDIDRLLRERKVNRLENIAVRNVEILDAWQEAGQDFIRALFSASLLDYTTDDATGDVVSGSRTVPVTFAEYWTFTRPSGSGSWKLSAISQA